MIIDTNTKSFQIAFIITLFTLSALCFSAAVFSWTEPSSSPPNGNVAAPINTSATSQIKSGALSVNGLSVYGSQYIQNNLGVGTTNSSSWRIAAQGSTYGIYADATTGQAIRGDVAAGGTGYAGWFDASSGASSAGGLFARNGGGYYAYLGYPGSSWSVYANGPTYTGSYSRADGGFCIGGSCKSSWTPNVTTASCSAYGGDQTAVCTATCPGNSVMVGGGCNTSGSQWVIWKSYPSGNGWYCAAQEDWGASQYGQYVYGYARCMY